jgi:aryl-alcohol dehydrogenase-like predicted oxidoreductase
VLSYPLNIHALVGSANADEVASNQQALVTRLSDAEMAWLDLRSEEC